MTPNTILVPRSVKEWGLPKKRGDYFVLTKYKRLLIKKSAEYIPSERGFFDYSASDYPDTGVEYWLEEVELPDDLNKIFPTDNFNSGEDDNADELNHVNELRQEGAKHILNLIFKK